MRYISFDHDDRRRVVLADDDAQAVRQLLVDDRNGETLSGHRRCGRRQRRRDDNAKASVRMTRDFTISVLDENFARVRRRPRSGRLGERRTARNRKPVVRVACDPRRSTINPRGSAAPPDVGCADPLVGASVAR